MLSSVIVKFERTPRFAHRVFAKKVGTGQKWYKPRQEELINDIISAHFTTFQVPSGCFLQKEHPTSDLPSRKS